MALRSTASTAALLVFVGLILAMVIGFQLGQPVLLGFVVTGSMSPTLEPGDGFVAVPPSLAGEIEPGDVVTFHAQELEGGGLTTHRVVGETSEGYVTRGDANPFTDQDGPEPPVQDSQIVAVALQVGGEVVVLPHLGTGAMAIQGGVEAVTGAFAGVPGLGSLAGGNVGTTMVGLGVLILLLSFVPGPFSSKERGGGKRSRSREGVWKASLLLAVILLLIVAPVTANMVIPSGTQDITIVSSSSQSENPTVIQVGTSRDFTFNVSNNGFVPRVVMLEPAGPGVEVDEPLIVLPHGAEAERTVTVHAANQTGTYVRSLSERHYLQLLPVSVIVSLHRAHPWLAILAVDLVVASVVTAVFLASFGFRPLRLRSRERDLDIVDRLNRVVRRWL